MSEEIKLPWYFRLIPASTGKLPLIDFNWFEWFCAYNFQLRIARDGKNSQSKNKNFRHWITIKNWRRSLYWNTICEWIFFFAFSFLSFASSFHSLCSFPCRFFFLLIELFLLWTIFSFQIFYSLRLWSEKKMSGGLRETCDVSDSQEIGSKDLLN